MAGYSMTFKRFSVFRNYKCRFFSKVSVVREEYDNPRIDILSKLINVARLEGSEFETSLDEESIIECLRGMTNVPVPKSKYPFLSYSNFPRSKFLPPMPTSESKEELVQFVDKLTTFQYPKPRIPQISRLIHESVSAHPEFFPKESYLKIVYFYNYHSNLKLCFDILNTMIQRTDLKQDIEFHNVIISDTFKPSNMKKVIERLESLEHRGMKANTNTWYHGFTRMKNSDPKIQLIEMMQELNIPLYPILHLLKPLAGYFTPEKLNKLFEKEGVSIERDTLTSPLFNILATSYLRHNQISELWDLIEGTPQLRPFMNTGLYVTFIEHFLSNNQLGFAFAFTQYVQSKFGLRVSKILISMIVNKHLPNCSYFENWISIVRILYPKAIRDSSIFLNTKTLSNLQDYATLYRFDNNFESVSRKDKEIKRMIDKSLVWKDKPIFSLSENAKSFIDCAKMVGQPI